MKGLIAAKIDNDPISDSTIDDFDKVMNVNAKGILTCTRAISKAVLAQESSTVKTRSGTRDVGKGSIVDLGSANSYAAIPGKVAYVASKHAMMGITKTAGKPAEYSSNRSNIDTILISSGSRIATRTCERHMSNLGSNPDV